MSERTGFLRIYDADDDDYSFVGEVSPHVLATRELLRSPVVNPDGRALEAFSRAWFEEVEFKRYQRQGEWLPRWLEVSRHSGESMLMIGPGLGCDALQYHRHGTHVTICATPDDDAELLHTHFRLRGQELPILHAPCHFELPFLKGQFDLAYWNGLHGRVNAVATLAELWRVLKPGGKLFALVPARVDVDRWARWLAPLRRYYSRPEPRPTTAPRRTAREMAPALKAFENVRIVKRHLRPGELPRLWRVMPINLMERLMGRVLAIRAFKPVSAAMPMSRAHAA
jgi:SAM-dependent methyltransferase